MVVMGYFDKWKKSGSDDGKSAEEQSKAEMDALVERFGAAVEERVKPLRETVERLQTDWESIKAEATKETPTGPMNADGTPRELTADEKNQNTQANIAALAVQTNARLTEREVIDEIAASWPDQVAEIRGHFANTELKRKALPDYPEYCRNIVDMVVGRAAKKSGLRYDGQAKTFFLEDKSSASTPPDSPLNDPSLVWNQVKSDGSIRRWTAEEQLHKLGINPEEFVKNVKEGVV
jgi:hypothetical protein